MLTFVKPPENKTVIGELHYSEELYRRSHLSAETSAFADEQMRLCGNASGQGV
jgi:hypothetical protein